MLSSLERKQKMDNMDIDFWGPCRSSVLFCVIKPSVRFSSVLCAMGHYNGIVCFRGVNVEV
jgi:hypothetical protein